jgi:hypothetical protein
LLDLQGFEFAARAMVFNTYPTDVNATRILSGIMIAGRASFSSFMLPPPAGVSIPYGMDGTECPNTPPVSLPASVS